jgi:hypothetical protein
LAPAERKRLERQILATHRSRRLQATDGVAVSEHAVEDFLKTTRRSGPFAA